MKKRMEHTFECGCGVAIYEAGASINQCSLHRAASDLLAACEGIMEWLVDEGSDDEGWPLVDQVKAAIAKAKGGKT